MAAQGCGLNEQPVVFGHHLYLWIHGKDAVDFLCQRTSVSKPTPTIIRDRCWLREVALSENAKEPPDLGHLADITLISLVVFGQG
jgi:hypothetical protein